MGITPGDSDFNLLIQTQKLTSLTVKDGKLTRKKGMDWIKGLFGQSKITCRNLLKIKIAAVLEEHKNNVSEVATIYLKLKQLRDPQFIYYLRNKNILTDAIENVLNPELAKLRKDTTKDPLIKLLKRIERARVAILLGANPASNKGATGTVLLKSTKGTYLGVFKPIHSHTPIITRIKDTFKKAFKGQLYYLKKTDEAQAQAEVAAYLLDRGLKFHLTPPSMIAEIEGKKGAFQLFLKDFQEAKEILSQHETTKTYDSASLVAFQKLAVFDFLIGNLDRHEENWFVDKTSGNMRNIKAIDNANSFLQVNPKKAGEIKNQYKWKELHIAKQSFQDNVKEFVKRNITEKKLHRLIQYLDIKLPGFLDDKMKNNLYLRAAVLRKAVSQESFFIDTLGSLVTENAMQNFLLK